MSDGPVLVTAFDYSTNLDNIVDLNNKMATYMDTENTAISTSVVPPNCDINGFRPELILEVIRRLEECSVQADYKNYVDQISRILDFLKNLNKGLTSSGNIYYRATTVLRDMADGYEDEDSHARGIIRQSKTKAVETDFLPCSVNFHEYFMTYRRRGKCIIFNHKFFSGHEPRYGTDFDSNSLCNQFAALGFETEIFTNLTVCQVKKKLVEAGRVDHSDNSCFVCCILTYGEGGYLYAFDEEYPVEFVFAPFLSKYCPSLAGKPKMFFIQACHGRRIDIEEDVLPKQFLNCDFESKFPSEPDFLVACSTIPGALSSTITTEGSWFIQAVCDGIEEYAKSKDLISILTIANRKVAYDFESYKRLCQTFDPRHLVPLISSTLTRDVRFL